MTVYLLEVTLVAPSARAPSEVYRQNFLDEVQARQCAQDRFNAWNPDEQLLWRRHRSTARTITTGDLVTLYLQPSCVRYFRANLRTVRLRELA